MEHWGDTHELEMERLALYEDVILKIGSNFETLRDLRATLPEKERRLRERRDRIEDVDIESNIGTITKVIDYIYADTFDLWDKIDETKRKFAAKTCPEVTNSDLNKMYKSNDKKRATTLLIETGDWLQYYNQLDEMLSYIDDDYINIVNYRKLVDLLPYLKRDNFLEMHSEFEQSMELLRSEDQSVLDNVESLQENIFGRSADERAILLALPWISKLYKDMLDQVKEIPSLQETLTANERSLKVLTAKRIKVALRNMCTKDLPVMREKMTKWGRILSFINTTCTLIRNHLDLYDSKFQDIYIKLQYPTYDT